LNGRNLLHGLEKIVTLTAITALCLRVCSVYLLWKALFLIVDTYHAYSIYNSLVPGTAVKDPTTLNFIIGHGDISVQLCHTLFLNSVMYLLAAAALWFFSVSLARLLNKGLECA